MGVRQIWHPIRGKSSADVGVPFWEYLPWVCINHNWLKLVLSQPQMYKNHPLMYKKEFSSLQLPGVCLGFITLGTIFCYKIQMYVCMYVYRVNMIKSLFHLKCSVGIKGKINKIYWIKSTSKKFIIKCYTLCAETVLSRYFTARSLPDGSLSKV